MAKEGQSGLIKDCRANDRQECMYSFGKIETELEAQKKSTEQLITLFDAKLAAIDVKLNAIEVAENVASLSLDKRLENMNEFRHTLRDQASQFVTREELKKESERIDADLRFLRESRALLEGKASQKLVSITLGLTILGLIIATVNVLMNIIVKLVN